MTDGGGEPAACRMQLDSADRTLNQAFRRNEPITRLLRRRAGVVDQLLRAAWQQHFPTQKNIALLAVGGYGRAELHPHSDIDLMILLADGIALEPLRANIEQFVAFCWDSRLKIGHSVRNLAQSVEIANADVTTLTALTEARLLCGPNELLQALRTVLAPPALWPSVAYFEAKLAEQQARHHRFHNSAYRLEPDLKEGPGGLRDIQTIGWITKRHFGTARLSNLVQLGFLLPRERSELWAGQEALWRIRYLLHSTTGRREDRLLFGHQLQLARLLGYHDRSNNLAVEQFMQYYYRHVMALQRLNEMLLQLLDEAIRQPQPGHAATIAPCFQDRHGLLDVTDKQFFIKHPEQLFAPFLALAKRPALQGMRVNTIRLLRDQLGRLAEIRHHPQLRHDFIALLKAPKGANRELPRLHRYGLLGAYLPAFERISGHMQYNLLHLYTVDEHSLFVVRNIYRFGHPKYSQQFPLCRDIISTIPRLEVLYLAALFHDIAKGRQGDHSLLGRQEAIPFCRDHGLSEADSHLVGWLVEHHLLLTLTAQRRDLRDPSVIQEVIEKMGSLKRLNHLYLLTIADTAATHPGLLNQWRSQLLKDLYFRSRQRLLSNAPLSDSSEHRIASAKRAAMRLLAHCPKTPLQVLWKALGDSYFLHFSPAEIVWHSDILLATENHQKILAVHAGLRPGSSDIFAYDRQHIAFFYQLCSALEREACNILNARIVFAEAGYMLAGFSVLDAHRQPLQTPLQAAQLQKRLIQAWHGPLQAVEKRPTPRRLQHFKQAPIVSLRALTTVTELRLQTRNRPALLLHIAAVLHRLRLYVRGARITTLGERIDDVLLITDEHGQMLDTELMATVKSQLLATLKA